MVSKPEPDETRWDWSSTLLIVLVVLVVAILTFEIWAPHFGVHR